ncbi:FabD/lysophospholipase-like protein [Acaromyces ingoldii]|uniref:FabD/lysophospholipase-like protein n=1 Tax=Acaromyces ingoldii TaxID=215250 RepID=A0A316YJQ5_9BASI|nr:FabD/lysophospholipase-like protein [Acaromyces ingoldii]PWN89780.1 FabD/lysophospholipase-like protein [Acaromyces ingoldii]
MGRIARGAARSFYDNNCVYRKTFEEVSMRFSQQDPAIDLVQAVYGNASHGEIEPNALETSTATAQPALFAVYYSLWKATTSLLRQSVDIVFGHSFGEIAAACASGMLSLEDAVELVYVRSRCCEATSRHCPGAMLAVRCTKANLVQSGILQPASEIVIAAENAEEAYTISLPAAELESVEARLRAAGIPFRLLKTQSVAFHHPMLHRDSALPLAAVDEKLARLAVDRAKEAPSASKLEDGTDKPSFVSCSRPTAPDTLPSWHQHLCQPVHYARTAEAVLFAQTSPLGRRREETKAAVVLEIGLGAELSSLTRRRALHSNAANVAVPVEAVSLFGSQGDDCFVETVKRLFELGVDVQLPVSLATRRQPILALNRRRFWPEVRSTKASHIQYRPQHAAALEKRSEEAAAPSLSWSRHQRAERVQTGRGWAEHHLVCDEEQRDPFSIAAWLSSLLSRRSGERTCYIFQDKQPLSSSGNADVVLTARASPGQAGFTVSVTSLEQQSHDGGGAFKHLEATPLANLDELPAWINAYEASSTSAEPSNVHLLDVPNAGNDVVYLLQTSSTAFEALLSCSAMPSMWTCLVNIFASLGLDKAMTPLLLDVAALQEGAAEESDALRVSIVKRDDVWRAVVRTVDGDLVCALQSAASTFAPSASEKSTSTHGSPALTSSSFAPSSPGLQGSGSSCCSSVSSLSSSITSHFSSQTTSHIPKLPGADLSNASSDALSTLVGAALRLEPERIESKRQLGDYGLDSFRATHLSEMLDARFGVDVSHVSLLQDMTLSRLRDLVSSR